MRRSDCDADGLKRCKTKNIFSFVFSSVLGGIRRGAQEGGVQSGSEGFRPRSGSNICWFRREAVGSPKKEFAPVRFRNLSA